MGLYFLLSAYTINLHPVLCHSMIEDNIWDLSLILLSVVVFFFPFGCPPLSNNSLFFVKFKQPETECLER